ncbi:unnamed protein product [Nesidiocoris tenuis]|uniref:Uncharacterized protein n=1 Tax=Nesidiocoris tenuis TaxID=355587 RepID=A0A6H5GRB0_9HEMI|nr:unnamed protein product [Nesidiocoris tenuis]
MAKCGRHLRNGWSRTEDWQDKKDNSSKWTVSSKNKLHIENFLQFSPRNARNLAELRARTGRQCLKGSGRDAVARYPSEGSLRYLAVDIGRYCARVSCA